MNVSEFLFKRLNPIANSFPIAVPIETDLPYITYSIDSQEVTKTITRTAYIENFVTVNVYCDEYDKAENLGSQVQIALGCIAEQNIMGVTFSGKSSSFDGQPVDVFSVTLEFSVYERGL